MFFDDPGAAFANIHRALRPGGRLAFLCWQALELNEHMTIPFATVAPFLSEPPRPGAPEGPGPFSLADPERIRTLLDDAGFTDVTAEPSTETMRMGADADDVAAHLMTHPVARTLLRDATPGIAAKAAAALREALHAHAGPDGVRLASAAWLVTATA